MSDSVRPQRRQPTRLPHPWDSPGKNTGVGCHFLLQSMKVKSESEVVQSCPTLTLVGKVTSLLLNMLSRLVITFLPRSKCLLISWLQLLSAVICKPPKIVCHCFHCFPIYLPRSDGTGNGSLAWKILWMEEPGGPQSMGSLRVGHD